jgi:hypothetical protein
MYDPLMATPVMNAVEYRERARACRKIAAEGGEAADDFLQAAQTWDALAEHADQSALFPLIKPK